jgi:hypothetical protein
MEQSVISNLHDTPSPAARKLAVIGTMIDRKTHSYSILLLPCYTFQLLLPVEKWS